MRVVGAAYTEFTQKIANNNDLIRAIKEGWVQAQGGSVLKEMEEDTNFLLQKAANAGTGFTINWEHCGTGRNCAGLGKKNFVIYAKK